MGDLGYYLRLAAKRRNIARIAAAAMPPTIYPIAGSRFRPPSLTGATRKKHTQMKVRNVAGSDMSQCDLRTEAKYVAHVHNVMVARTWFPIPT